MVLRPDPHPERWGNPRADDSPDAVRFLASLRPLMFTGVHVLSPRFLDRVPATGASCIVRTAYAELYRERGEVSRVVTRRYWHEHSTADGYLEGVARVLAGDAGFAHAERPLRGVDPSAAVEGGAEIVAPVWVGRRARIEAGARVGPFVQVGDGATVGRGARLTRAVVWDGVRVDEDVVNAVRAR